MELFPRVRRDHDVRGATIIDAKRIYRLRNSDGDDKYVKVYLH